MNKEKVLAKKEMNWRRPSFFRREYELQVAGQLVARLRQVGLFRVQAEIHEVDGPDEPVVITCERTGLFRQKFHVKSLDYRYPSTKPVSLSWKGEGSFQLPDGRRYTWRPTNFMHSQWSLLDEAGTVLVQIKRSTWGYGGHVTIHDNQLDQDDLLFLIYVGWYLVIMKMDDAAAAAAAS